MPTQPKRWGAVESVRAVWCWMLTAAHTARLLLCFTLLCGTFNRHIVGFKMKLTVKALSGVSKLQVESFYFTIYWPWSRFIGFSTTEENLLFLSAWPKKESVTNPPGHSALELWGVSHGQPNPTPNSRQPHLPNHTVTQPQQCQQSGQYRDLRANTTRVL